MFTEFGNAIVGLVYVNNVFFFGNELYTKHFKIIAHDLAMCHVSANAKRFTCSVKEAEDELKNSGIINTH